MDDFLKTDVDLKNKLLPILQTYQRSIYCTNEQSEDFTRNTCNLCKELAQAALHVNEDLAGLVLDLNLFNLFALFKNYRQKARSLDCPQLLCAAASGQLIRHFMERIIQSTDKFFLLAPCNDLQISPAFATSMYTLLAEVRVKAVGQGRMLGSGRIQVMKAGKDVLDTYSSLKQMGLINPRVQKFLQLVFTPVNIDSVFCPLFKREQEIREQKASLFDAVTLAPRRRCPNKSILTENKAQRYVIPDSLLYPEDADGNVTYGNPDMSQFLGTTSNMVVSLKTTSHVHPPEPNPIRKRAIQKNRDSQCMADGASMRTRKCAKLNTTEDLQPSTSSASFGYSPEIHTPQGTLIPISSFEGLLHNNWETPSKYPQSSNNSNYYTYTQQSTKTEETNEKHTSQNLDNLLQDLLDFEEQQGQMQQHLQNVTSETMGVSQSASYGVPVCDYKQPDMNVLNHNINSPLSTEMQNIFSYLSEDIPSLHELHVAQRLVL